jgi:hypothetical protein
MTQEQKIQQLENQLKQVLEAYNILEEYACDLADEGVEDNETIAYANSIVTIALHIDNE